MASSLHVFGPLVILILSVPLTILAYITSTLAFSILFFRVSIVYCELLLALVQSWVLKSNAPPVVITSPKVLERAQNPARRRRRNSSFVRHQEQPANLEISGKNEGLSSLLGPNDPARDFEGLGGWRVQTEEEDAVWMSINSRLQLPTAGVQPSSSAMAIASPASAGMAERRSKLNRSISSLNQRVSWSPEAFRTSPVESRNRTPPATAGLLEGRSPEGYFDIRSDMRMMSPGEITTKVRMAERRASISSSNNSINSTGAKS